MKQIKKLTQFMAILVTALMAQNGFSREQVTRIVVGDPIGSISDDAVIVGGTRLGDATTVCRCECLNGGDNLYPDKNPTDSKDFHYDFSDPRFTDSEASCQKKQDQACEGYLYNDSKTSNGTIKYCNLLAKAAQ
jgi:hypothetical protein